MRHIKLWRLGDLTPNSPTKAKASPEPTNVPSSNAGPISLSGRNCLLGTLRDSVFTCISSVSDNEAIVCTDTGAVCFLDDTAGQQKLSFVKNFHIGISSLAIEHDSAMVWFGCRDGTFQQLSMEDLKNSISTLNVSWTSERPQTPKLKKPSTISMGVISKHIVAVDSTRAIRVHPLASLDHCRPITPETIEIPAHKDSVLGIGAVTAPDIHSGAQFFTWSSNGAVSFWDSEGSCHASRKVKIEQPLGNCDEPNELKVLRATQDMNTFVSGDKYGVIRFESRPLLLLPVLTMRY